MRKFILICLLAILATGNVIVAQDRPAGQSAGKNYFKFQARAKIGIGKNFTALPAKFEDFNMKSMYDSNRLVRGAGNEILKTTWGLYGGANLDFYLHPNFGLGIDFDYFHSKLKFIAPQAISDFVNAHPETAILETHRRDQSLFFIGIGPSFKIFTNSKWDVDANIRAGWSRLSMGSLNVGIENLTMNAVYNPRQQYILRDSILWFDYHKPVNAFGIKIGLYGNYWFNSFIGVTLGVDYIHSFVSASKIRDDKEFIFKYKDPDFYKTGSGDFDPYTYFNGDYFHLDNYPVKSLNANHFSVSAGLVFRVLNVSDKKEKPGVKDIVVMVKDSLTNIPVSGVEVTLKNFTRVTVRTGITGDNGKVKFEKVAQGDYTLSGTKGTLITTQAKIDAGDFMKRGNSIYRELLLNDLRFILAGVTVECDQKDNAIGGVEIELTNKATGKAEKAISGADGKFTFSLEPNADYTIVGSKGGYYSGIQEITTKGLDRSKTLYVKLVLCVDELKVGSTFVLNNIYYDFDKCDIRKDASVDLNHLVDIMNNYPGMEIELSSHTDQRGSDAYNNKLSQCRAESAVAYIVGKGISKQRITAVGYGKTRPIQDCTAVKGCPTTSEGDCPCHQKNRRTEIKILKK